MRFTPGELKIMQLLWEHGEQKPAELQRRFPEPIKNSALRSYLTILLEKGHVTRRKSGKAYLYKAKTKQTKAFRAMLDDLVDAFCEGSTRNLLLTLVQHQELSDADLQELQVLADKHKVTEAKRSERKRPSRSKRGDAR